MASWSGILSVMLARKLSSIHLAADECPRFEYVLEAKIRLAVGLLYGALCLRVANGPIRFFRLAHFYLILSEDCGPDARRSLCFQV
jgi:hypothetical protein